MPVYIVTGKLGSGKTLSMVGRIRDYLARGRPVATNVDLNIRELCRKRPVSTITRLPDRPSAEDLAALGAVHSTGQESLNGALVLDECGTWLNSRQWNDKGRTALMDWLLHSRKLGWDVFLIVQNLALLDKQIRDAIAEYLVVCRRTDRLKIPFVGKFVNWLTGGMVKGQMPQVHLAIVHYGIGAGSLRAETWIYRGRDLYAAYQTVQVVTEAVGGAYSLVWYATEAERAAWPKPRKPKLPHVAAVMALPVGQRIAALRNPAGLSQAKAAAG